MEYQLTYEIYDEQIKIIVKYKNNYYEIDIENNIINKSLIDNNTFMLRLCDNILIMYDDNNKFMLDKMECNYSDYINIKEQLENTQKELEQIKSKINKIELEQFKPDLEQFKTDLEQFKPDLEQFKPDLEQFKTDMEQIKNKLNNNEHLMQQQLRIYYDKETKQMKISELPYIMLKDKITGIEKFLYDKSKLLCDDSIVKKINNFVIQDKWKKHFAKIGKSIEIGNLVNRNMVQVIIPPNKMLKLWTNKRYPTNYTSGIYYLQFTSNPAWYGDINEDYDFLSVIDEIMDTVFRITVN